MTKTHRRNQVLCLAVAMFVGLSLTGCPSTMAAIEDSSLSEADKSQAKLYAAERGWVSVKTALADTLTDLALLGIVLPDDVKLRILQARDGGNLALANAHLALDRGEVSTSEQFAAALRLLLLATRQLAGETAALSPGAPAPAAEE